MLVPQVKFLDFLALHAREYPQFRLVMGANVEQWIEEGGQVRSVRYLTTDGKRHVLRALLTVGADGRFSKVRHLAGIQPVKTTQTAWRRERDSNPRYPFRYSGFQDRLFQPLTHPSA